MLPRPVMVGYGVYSAGGTKLECRDVGLSGGGRSETWRVLRLAGEPEGPRGLLKERKAEGGLAARKEAARGLSGDDCAFWGLGLPVGEMAD